MRRIRPFTLLIALAAMLPICAAAQPADRNSDAEDLLHQGLSLIDSGRYEESRELLMRARALDSADIEIGYALGQSYLLEKNYPKAADYLYPLLNAPNATDRHFRAAAALAEASGDRDRAAEINREGSRRFPTSTLFTAAKVAAPASATDASTTNGSASEASASEASASEGSASEVATPASSTTSAASGAGASLTAVERRIASAPSNASNYYGAAREVGSASPIWGALYAELFMNLERATDRTGEMSGLLYDLYRTTIQSGGGSDGAARATGSGSTPLSMDFENAYRMALRLTLPSLATANGGPCEAGSIGYECLCAVRKQFIQTWFASGQNRAYPNPLFDREREMESAGVLDAYNHWVLAAGDPSAFDAWTSAHASDWSAFLDWISSHPMKVDGNNLLLRASTDASR